MATLNSDVLNTVEEIREECLLEIENQTLTDDQFITYLNSAHKEMVSDLHRAIEYDEFIAEASGEVVFLPYFNVLSVSKIFVNDVEITSADYSLVYNNDGVSIKNIEENDVVKIYSIPTNYKECEKAYCIVKIMTRLNPFINDVVNPVYAEWRDKKKNFLNGIKSKFGAANYRG